MGPVHPSSISCRPRTSTRKTNRNGDDLMLDCRSDQLQEPPNGGKAKGEWLEVFGVLLLGEEGFVCSVGRGQRGSAREEGEKERRRETNQ